MLGRGVTIRFVADPEAAESDLVVVLDEAWTPGPDADRRVIPVRMVFGRVLAAHDLWTEARDRLDAWATEGRVPERMTVDGSSFWFHRRLSMWWWLQARLVWLYVIDDLLSGERAGSIELAEDADQALLDVVTAVAARDGATVRLRAAVQTGDEEPSEPDPGEGTEAAPTGPPALGAWPRQLIARVRARHRRWVLKRRRARMDRLVASIGAGPRPLLVLTEHIRQRVETVHGPRLVNAYLDPILDRLAGTALAPLELALDAAVTDDRRWSEIRRRPRTLAGDLLVTNYRRPDDKANATARADPIVADLEAHPRSPSWECASG